MFWRWRFELPAAFEDRLSADLWSSGCLGLQVGPLAGFGRIEEPSLSVADQRIQLEAWFPDPLPDPAQAFDVSTWARLGAELVVSEAIVEQDWLAEYRATVEPFDVGRGFRVDPRDADGSGQSDSSSTVGDSRRTLRIPAQTAFGTGSHESTRLMISLLEELPPTGCRVLDVGTGSGILALVCEHLGAARVIGYDLDPAAPLVALQNFCLNQEFAAGSADARTGGNSGSSSFFAGTAAALRPGVEFDYLLVNVLPERIAADLPRLVGMLPVGGRLVSSGNLLERREEILARFATLRLVPIREAVDGEWVAFVLETCRPCS